MRIKQTFLVLIFFASVVTSAPAQVNNQVAAADDSKKELIGEYLYSTGFDGASYTIRFDGVYEYVTFSDCCDPVWRESGSYTLRDNLLHFTITTKTLNGYDVLDPKQAAAAYQKVYGQLSSEVKPGEIKTEYDMQVVRWGARVYLIEPDEMKPFVTAVSLGIEPRAQIINLNYSGKFFLRRGDERKAVTGKPALPERWMSYLSPIRAKVTKIEFKDQKEIYTVNKVTADGVEVGMV